MAAIGLRLVWLQVGRYQELSQRAQKQTLRTIEVSPRRGVITDRNSRELAMSTEADSIFAAPGDLKSADTAVVLLSRVLRLDAAATAALRMRLDKAKQGGKSFCWIKRKVSPDDAARVRALQLAGVHVLRENKRFYPKGELAAHLLGFVDLDENGLAGVELARDKDIKGQSGKLLVQADGRRRLFGRADSQWVDSGQNVVLTIDEKIQFLVEEELRAAVARTRSLAATVIVMDPNNGEILALANRPAFDPNEPQAIPELQAIPRDLDAAAYQARWNEVWEKHTLNRAIGASYEPGSTMKIITVAAALEERVTTPDEVIDCQMGSINVFGHVIRDHQPFGLLTVNQVMANSSDVGAIKLGLRLGKDRLWRYMKAFGLGQRTGIDLLREAAGLTRDPAYWTKSSVASISMGQEVGATPLQMAVATSVVANGGYWVRPRLIRSVYRPGRSTPWPDTVAAAAPPPQSRRRVISEETAARVRNMLEMVVTEGTAKSARLQGYTAAGKTGTAQKYDPRIKTYSPTDHVASFIGFAPFHRPVVTIAVILDSPVGAHHGGDVAAPLFKRIAEKTLAYLEAPRDLPAADPPPPPKDPPAGPEETLPPPALPFPQGVAVVGLEGAPVAPDFLGLPLRAVAQKAAAEGLDVELLGTGVARQQAPAPGERLLPRQRVMVRFGR
jgi:cell division protein FtsI (penicillin-binding protein 3)